MPSPTPAFASRNGCVLLGPQLLTDADAAAVGEVYRDQLRAAYDAQDWAAHEAARRPLHELRLAEARAQDFRRDRARMARLAASLLHLRGA